MNHLFVTYELSLLAKEKGFDEPCLGYYDNAENDVWITITPPYYAVKKHVYLAPLYQQLVDWFREKHKLHLDVTFREVKGNIVSGINSVYFDIEIYMLSGGDAHKIYKFSEYSDNYYETLTKAIEQAFLLI